MDSGLKLWGIFTATAIVLSNDCPTLVKAAAKLAKIVFGNRIQICGATANQVEMMAAFDTLPNEGGKVILLGNQFSINGTIYFPEKSGVFLEGQGLHATEIVLADNSDCNMVEWSPTVHTLFGGISRMELFGNKANQASGNGIVTTSADGDTADDLMFADIMVSDVKEIGFSFYESWGYHFINLLSEYCGSHGFWQNGQENYMTNFFSAFNDGYGFYCSGSLNHYTNMNSWSCGLDGIYLKDDYSSFTGVRVFNWGSAAADTHYGIFVFSGAICNSVAGVMIRGTTNGNKSWIGIQINGDDNAFSAVKVIGCTNDGIEINGDNNSVDGNCLGNATVDGTDLDDNGTNNNCINLVHYTGQPKVLLPLKIEPTFGQRWVLPGWLIDGQDAPVAVTAGRVYYTPIFNGVKTTYIRVAIQITVGAVGTAEIWLYKWNNGLAGDKIVDLGTIGDTTVVAVNEIVISLVAEPQTYYFLAIRFTGTPTVVIADDRSTLLAPVQGQGTSFMYHGNVIMWVAGNLTDPATAPTGAATVNSIFLNMREN